MCIRDREKGSSGFLGFNSKPAKIKARKKYTVADHIKNFLSQVFAAMGLEVEILINASAEEENVYDVELKGAEMGVLIGKRGQTLDSLQYLTNLAINKHSDTYTRVKLDTEDYRCLLYTSNPPPLPMVHIQAAVFPGFRRYSDEGHGPYH